MTNFTKGAFRAFNLCAPVTVLAILASPTALTQQSKPPSSEGLQGLGTQAIQVILAQEVVNSYSIDPKIGKPLAHNGKWLVDNRAPQVCPQTTQPCVRVSYQVLESGVLCTWVVLFEGDGRTGKLLDQNDDASRYFLLRLSSETTENLVENKKMPVYPPIAAAAHVSGQIEIQIVVGLDGKITNVGMPVGPAMLRASAVEAVKEWTFKPYRIGTHPVPFTTLITFQFTTTGTHSEKIQSIP